jgi:hypothetical protein
MKNKNVLTLAILLIGTLLASTGISIASAFPDNVVAEKVFTTYIGGGTPGTDTYDEFQYTGIHWPSGTTVTYSVNTKGAPDGALQAVKAAFETWDAAVKIELFNDNVAIASSKAVGNKYDGANVISWGRLRPGIIAQTTTWYNRANEIVEVGMVFNTYYLWSISPVSNAFDVQDIATHEAGHTLMLLDLYDDAASQLTMYGYGDFGQTYAQTLGTGDISGIHYIYGK